MKVDELAKLLHLWYLEVTEGLSSESFNSYAQKSYEDLSDEQRSIDTYIATKIIEIFNLY